MTATNIVPGQTFDLTTDVASGNTYTAHAGSGGMPGGVIDTTGSVTSYGGIYLLGGYPISGESAAQLDNTGTLLNKGTLSVGGGQAGYGPGTGAIGATLIDSGLLSNGGMLTLDGGQAGAPGSASAAGGTLVDTGTLTNAGRLDVGGGAGGANGAVGGSGAHLLDSGVLMNVGTIDLGGGGAGSYGGSGAMGATLNVGGVLSNQGVIEVGAGDHGSHGSLGGSGSALLVFGTLNNTGTVTLDGGSGGHKYGLNTTAATLIDRGMLTNAGTIDVTAGRGGMHDAVLRIGIAGTLADSGMVTGGGTLTNLGLVQGHGASGTIDIGSFFNDGTILSQADLVIDSAITADAGQTRRLDVTAGGTLTLNGGVAADQALVFDGVFGQVDLGAPASFDAAIGGFGGADRLDLTGLAYVAGSTTAAVHHGVLTVSDGATSDSFTLLGVPNGTVFTVSADGSAQNGVLIQEAAQCYVRGTRLQSARGEVAVEDLHIGDLLVTLHGGSRPIKWIGHRRYEGRFIGDNHLMLPVCIRADALGPDLPRRDLHVSAGHGVFVDGVLVPAWRLVNGASVTQDAVTDEVSYYHVELEDHEIVFAEGAPAESFLDEGSRDQFHNAAEYHHIFPGAPSEPARPCVDRVEDGFVLHAIQQRVAARARVSLTEAAAPGPLRGYLEVAGPERLVGWAQDVNDPERPVCLDVFANERRIGRILANRFRADVRAAGLGSGCHGFDLALPAGEAGLIEVRRAGDGAALTLAGAEERAELAG